MGAHCAPLRKKKSSAVLFFEAVAGLWSAPDYLRKGVIHKRVETLVSTLLCPCRAGKIRSLRKRLFYKHRCAHQTCVIAERRTDDLGISVLTAEGLRESKLAQRLEQLFAVARQSAAEHDTLRLEQIHKTCQTVRQIAAVFVEQLLRERVTRVYRIADLLGVQLTLVYSKHALSSVLERTLGKPHERSRRAVRLQTAAPSAVARLAVFSDNHVPDLTGNAVAAGVQLAVNDNAAANAGAERYHQHVARALGRTGSRFAERGAVCVVIQMHRTAELRQKRIRKTDVIQTQIGTEPQGAGFLVKRAGHADADRRYVLYRTAVR